MDQPTGTLIAFRADRLGGRLIALLNTMRFARSYGLPFVVHWRDSDGMGDGTELFSEDFVRDHFIDKQTYQQMRDAATAHGAIMSSNSAEAFLDFLRDGRHILFDPPFDVLRMPFESEEAVRATFREVVDSLPLNPVLQEHLDDLRARLHDGRRTVSYHIRRGDLTSDMRAMNRAWPNKFVPDEFFEAHIRANLEGSGTRTVLFSDNKAVLDRYTRMFPGLLTFADIADTSALTPVQRDALELFAMSLSDLIVALPSSAFSSTARTIGGCAFRDVEADISPAERLAALDVLAARMKDQPEFFANEGEIGQYMVYVCNHLVETGRRAEFIRIARAHVERGLNIAFVHALLFREMFNEGQFQEICDLRPVVDRGFVLFQRSFAQVALYHGLALLMLGRRAEGLRQIVSAFWHEPIEGEINTLAGLLRRQGDFDDTNFWPTDPVVEPLFPNRTVVDITRRFYTGAISAGVLQFNGMVPASRVAVWEWPDFTRSDHRNKERLFGHFRTILKILARRSWAPEPKPHFDSFTGMIALREGNLEQAEGLILSSIAARPDIALFHKRLAELRHHQGRPDEAMAALDHAIGLAPHVSMLRALKGLFLFRAGDAEAAADTLCSLMDEGRLHFPSVFFLAADAARKAGRIGDAIRMLQSGLDLSPMQWRRQFDLASMKAETGDAEGAIRVLDWALQWASDHPPLVLLQTDLLIASGQAERARAVLEAAIRHHPDKKQYQRRRHRLEKA